MDLSNYNIFKRKNVCQFIKRRVGDEMVKQGIKKYNQNLAKVVKLESNDPGGQEKAYPLATNRDKNCIRLKKEIEDHIRENKFTDDFWVGLVQCSSEFKVIKNTKNPEE